MHSQAQTATYNHDRKTSLAGMLVAIGQAPQTLKLPLNIENLSCVASETVDVTMDGTMLRFAEQFLSDRDPEQTKAKQ